MRAMLDGQFMQLALRLARRGYGTTSPNPLVGAVLVKNRRVIGRGWHRRAGLPHAEIEALRDARKKGHDPHGATLYVTLEPCCTHGRTPPCTGAIIAAGIKRVVIGAGDPNPRHSGKGFKILRAAGVTVDTGNELPSGRTWADDCVRLNEAFNHWIVQQTPFVTVKAAMTLDGKIATAAGESKWITGEKSRAWGMKLRQGHDAILVGINTILADDPALTARAKTGKAIRRIILDSLARTPPDAKVVSDKFAALTTIVVSKLAPRNRVAALAKRVNVMVAPAAKPVSRVPRPASLDLRWLLKRLGREEVTSLLVEGGGQVNASFLLGGLARRVAFFYAPKILGGRNARKAVAGEGAQRLADVVQLRDLTWKRLGPDWLLTARVERQL